MALLDLGEADDRIQREELAEGLPPGEEVTPLADVWTTAGLDSRIAHVEALADALSQLVFLLPEVQKQTGIDDAATASIADLIGAATAGLGVLEFGEWTGVVGRLKELQDVLSRRDKQIETVVALLSSEIRTLSVRGTDVFYGRT